MSFIHNLMHEVCDYKRYVKNDFKVAVIGFGKMGILHSTILNLLKPNFVRIIVDKSRSIILGTSLLIEKVKFYRNIGKVLCREEPDICYVTTPAITHYSITSKLLETGVKYIFVEKPPTVSFTELNSLLDKASGNEISMVGFQKRYAFPFRHAKTLLSEYTIGDIDKVYGYIKSGDIVALTDRFNNIGRGVLLDLGIHLIDLLEWLIGLESVEEANCWKKYTSVDDYLKAKLRASNNADVHVEVTWSDPSYRLPETYIEILGTDGTLKVTEDYLRLDVKDEKNLTMCKPHYYQGIPPVNLADPEYTLENIHFLHCICKSKEPLTSLKNVRRTMKLIDELYKIAREKHG